MTTAFALDYRRRALLALFSTAALAIALGFLATSFAVSTFAGVRGGLASVRAALAADPSGERERSLEAGLTRELLPGDSDAQAQAAMQDAIKAIAQPNDLMIANWRPSPASTDGGLAVARLQLAGSLPEARLAPLLEALLASEPSLLPVGLEIAPEASLPGADGAAPARRLSIQIDFAAFYRAAPSAGNGS